MSDKRQRKTLTILPSVGASSAPAGHILADLPPTTARATMRNHGTAGQGRQVLREPRRRGNNPEQCLDMRYVVSHLLAEGEDTEETLTRVCAVLRDSMGWNEVVFWPVDAHGHVLPSMRIEVSRNQPHTLSTPIHHAGLMTDIRLVECVSATREPACVTTRARGGTSRRTAVAPSSVAMSAFAFPVLGTCGLLGVIECLGRHPNSPDVTLLGIAASLGSAIGQFIERQCESTERRYSPETEHVMSAERAHHASQLEAVFEALADSVLMFDRDGRILQANAADRAMFGYDGRSNGFTSTLRERSRLLMPRDEHDRPLTEDLLPSARILRGETLGGQHAMQAMIRTADGRDIQVSTSGAPIYDDEGDLVGGIAITRDITAQGQSERTLRDANRRMQEFLAVAAHDLRTPITSSRGYVQLATKRLSTVAAMMPTENPTLLDRVAGVRRNLEDAERSTQRLSLLVDRLLDVTRIQTGKLELRPEAANLAAIVRTAVQEQQLVAPTRVIRCELPPTVAVPTRADPIRIGQVLMNYLSNALKYSPEDSTVEVTLDIRHTRRAEARVYVRDSGSGIPRAQRERIWSRFEQLEDASQRGADTGLGLGLYISRAIVEAHGGRVGVKSVAGRGSTFWFSLPLTRFAE